jgi:PAS domain S-box-containing protein
MNNSDIEQSASSMDSFAIDRKNLQTFFDSIGDFLWVLDETGNILNCNNTVYDRLGYTPEELAGISVLLVHPPERRVEAMTIVQKMLQGEAEHCPIPLFTKNGMYIPVETYIKAGQWNGKPALFGWSKDISRLKLSEEKFFKTFHLTKIISGISEINSGIYTDVNEEFCNALGFKREEVIGHSSFELNIISMEERVAVFSRHDIRNGIHNVASKVRTKDGKILRVLLSAELIHVQDKQYVYTTAVDITPMEEANRLVRESKRKLEEAQRIGNIGDWSIDLDANEMLWSDQVYRIFGYEPAERETKEIFAEHLHPEDLPRFPLETGLLVNMEGTLFPKTEFRVIAKDGCIKFCQIWGEFTMDADGRKMSVNGTIQDITEHKRTEIELKELNAVKDKFLSIIAHDLRNPFNTILGYSELLVDSIQRNDLKNLERYSTTIQAASEQALSFLVNMLEWSRSSSGKIPFSPVTVEVSNLVLEVMSLLRYHADMKQIRIRTEIPEDLQVMADNNMFRTIVINLVSNAIKFSFKGGEVLVTAGMNNKNFELAVEDTGTGLPKEEIAMLFHISGKSPKTGTGDEKGTGLGLVLCKDFAERHFGKISVESELGKGSRFVFRIPVTQVKS